MADVLARAVEGQWYKEAQERGLRPDPIPMQWSLSHLPVAGPVTAALGAPDQPPAFPPLPGYHRVIEADLQAGGGRAKLHALYAGLASGRILVVGAPGAGKSGTAILLLLDALSHRGTLDDTYRPRVPVPVLLTAHGWDPNTTSAQEWLAERLAASYPMFAHRGGRAEAAELVAARDTLTLLLDGLDEMDESLRPAALRALGALACRVVVLTRSEEMLQAASEAWLAGSVAVQLRAVSASSVADYLHRASSGPLPTGWATLIARVREQPEGVLARGLSSPLTLTLLRDTYQASDDVTELLNPTRYPTTDAIEAHLIARVVPAAYARRPGRAAPRYSEQQARHTLTFIAQQMGKERDLAWWRIPDWVPALPRILVTGLPLGLPFGLVSGLVSGLGLGGGLGLGFGLGGGLVFGLVSGLGLGRGVRGVAREPRRIRQNWRAVRSLRILGPSLGGGLVGLLAGGLVFGLGGGLGFGLVFGLAGGLGGVQASFIEVGTSEGSPLAPREIWHNDQIAGLAVGLAVGLVGLLAGGLVGGFAGRLAVGLGGGLVCGLPIALAFPQTSATMLAWLQLQISGRVPPVRLMRFLEEARERAVLRTVGAVYQFRHATLQDHLASQSNTELTPSAESRLS